MTTISYRQVLDQTFDDKELVEALCDFIARYKEFGAFRAPALPSWVLVTLVDRIKTLSEQQVGYYTKGAQDEAYDLAAATEDLPKAANDDSAE